jgi:hypothetical protein
MAKMGRYCKAYPITRFREFPGWTENAQNARKVKQEVGGVEVDAPRPLTDEDHLYLQENLVVTDDIFLDENIIFDGTTTEWADFCKNTLKFEVPVYESAKSAGESVAGNSGQ